MYLSEETIKNITTIQTGFRDPWYRQSYDFIDIYYENSIFKKRFRYDRVKQTHNGRLYEVTSGAYEQAQEYLSNKGLL